jgi:hypothetical protein
MPQFRRTAVAEREPLPLPVLIDCLRDRAEVARNDEALALGCVADLLDQVIPHLQRLQQIEAGR